MLRIMLKVARVEIEGAYDCLANRFVSNSSLSISKKFRHKSTTRGLQRQCISTVGSSEVWIPVSLLVPRQRLSTNMNPWLKK